MSLVAAVARRVSGRANKGVHSRDESGDIKAPDPPFPNAKDASDYGPSFLKTLRLRNPDWFDRLDFVRLEDEAIEALFVTDNVRAKHSTILFPPPALRRRASQIRDFYRLGVRQQQDLIAKYADFAVDLPEPPPAEEPLEPKPCRGFTLADATSVNTSAETIGRITLGFEDLVAEAGQTRFQLAATDKKMRKQLKHPVAGVVMSGDEIRWKMEEVVVEDVEEEGEDNDGDVEDDDDFFEPFCFRAPECTKGEAPAGKQQCDACHSTRRAFFRRCKSTFDMNENPLSKKANKRYLRNLSLLKKKVEQQRKTIRLTQKNRKYYKDLYKGLSGKKNGISMPVNAMTNSIFSYENTPHLAKFLGEEVSKDSLAQYLWAEACRKQEVARISGRTAVRHCPVFLRLGIVIRKKMGYSGGLYDLLAAAFGLPTDRQLNEYEIPSSNDPDGIMHKTIKQAAEIFAKSNPDLADDILHHDRRVIVAFDSMSIKGRLVYGHHNNELVGVAKDAFEKDVILSELEERRVLGDDTSEAQDPAASAEVTLPPLAKHFLAVIATTLSGSAKHKYTFLAARYGLTSIDEQYLDGVLTKTYLALAQYGWVAVTVTGDGASENRSYFKKKATISARDVFDGHYSEELTGLPLDFNIAFPHPDPTLQELGVIIFIGGEMPHWVKKFRNNLCSTKRLLVFNGQEMQLSMYQKMWEMLGDHNIATASLRKYKFTWDHWLLNSYNKMRVFLAMHVLSQSMIAMIKDACEAGHGDIEDHESFIQIVSAVDRLVDIMNAQRFKNGKDKQVFQIDSPFHPHVFELFDILRVFEEWKEDTGGFTKEFITSQTYEDLVWMVFGVAGVACTYLDADESLKFHQGRSGTDICEHLFAMMRNINPNPTLQQARQCASKCSQFVKSNLFSFKGKNNAAGAPKDHSDFTQPLFKRSKKN